MYKKDNRKYHYYVALSYFPYFLTNMSIQVVIANPARITGNNISRFERDLQNHLFDT